MQENNGGEKVNDEYYDNSDNENLKEINKKMRKLMIWIVWKRY